jgi:hypothetical protein
VASLFALVVPTALGDTTQSSNWAGYAAHRSRVRFNKVVGTWRQPTAVCSSHTPTYSSVWVGLGGYSLNSQALEQIGSEVDCTASGQEVSTVWYELVPAASRTIRMTVHSGDELTGSVVVSGRKVILRLHDLTRHTTFTKTVRAKHLDTSSAEWIVEAPSECTSTNQCQTLTLADFGSATFSRASARTTRRHTGRISDRRWGATRIVLAAGQRKFIGSGGAPVQASPSRLEAQGSSFTVTYKSGTGTAQPAIVTESRRRASTASAGPSSASLSGLRPGGTRVR